MLEDLLRTPDLAPGRYPAAVRTDCIRRWLIWKRCWRRNHVVRDLTACLLAVELNSDRLLLLTDVLGVYADWPDPIAKPIGTVSPQSLRAFTFDPGSMAPKVEAACQFVQRTGKTAAIGALRDALAVFGGEAGTQIRLPCDE